MIHQHWWSVQHSSILLAGCALLFAWPFRRKNRDESTSEADESVEPEEQANPEIDNIDWGIRLGTLERYERAAERFRVAVDADHGDPVAKYNLALALDLAGKHEEAKGWYEQAIAIDGSAADPHANLGLALNDMNDKVNASKSVEAAVALAPQDAVLHYDLGCVYASQCRWAEAADQFGEAAKTDPKDAQTRFNLAMALRRLGRRADSERELRDFLALARGRYPGQAQWANGILRAEYGDSGDEDGS